MQHQHLEGIKNFQYFLSRSSLANLEHCHQLKRLKCYRSWFRRFIRLNQFEILRHSKLNSLLTADILTNFPKPVTLVLLSCLKMCQVLVDILPTFRSSSISRVTSSSLSRSATAAEVVTNSIVTDNNSSDDVVMIPCEFCDKPISSTKLLSHQAECVNPTNVRSVASTSTSNTSSSYTSRFTRASSISRSYSLTSTNSSSKIHKQVQQTETANTTSDTSSVNSRKTLATSSSSSIVNRYLSSPEPKTNGSKKYLPESPPSYEKDFGSSSYVGRSSYLVEESRREDRSSYSSYKSTETKTREKTEAPGMYTNDNDREGLRQMLSSLRRDPMDVEDDPDNNDGSFFPCEFCGDPYPCEFLMRHQVRMHLLFPFILCMI